MWKTIIFLVIAAAVLYVGYQYQPQLTSSGDVQDSTNNSTTVASDFPPAADQPKAEKIEDLKVGTGAEATTGKTVSVHYVGTLTDGTKFDSSRDRGEPFSFKLGNGDVIKGWDQGVAGMKVGGKRKLTIPPDLAYGSRAIGSIPANSTLVFEVELLAVN